MSVGGGAEPQPPGRQLDPAPRREHRVGLDRSPSVAAAKSQSPIGLRIDPARQPAVAGRDELRRRRSGPSARASRTVAWSSVTTQRRKIVVGPGRAAALVEQVEEPAPVGRVRQRLGRARPDVGGLVAARRAAARPASRASPDVRDERRTAVHARVVAVRLAGPGRLVGDPAGNVQSLSRTAAGVGRRDRVRAQPAVRDLVEDPRGVLVGQPLVDPAPDEQVAR